jgi:hypothetical protein
MDITVLELKITNFNIYIFVYRKPFERYAIILVGVADLLHESFYFSDGFLHLFREAEVRRLNNIVLRDICYIKTSLVSNFRHGIA